MEEYPDSAYQYPVEKNKNESKNEETSVAYQQDKDNEPRDKDNTKQQTTEETTENKTQKISNNNKQVKETYTTQEEPAETM